MESIDNALSECKHVQSDKNVQKFFKAYIGYIKSRSANTIDSDSDAWKFICEVFMSQDVPMSWKVRCGHILALAHQRQDSTPAIENLRQFSNSEWPFVNIGLPKPDYLSSWQPQLAYCIGAMEMYSSVKFTCSNVRSMLKSALTIIDESLEHIELKYHSVCAFKIWWKMLTKTIDSQLLEEAVCVLFTKLITIWDSRVNGLSSIVSSIVLKVLHDVTKFDDPAVYESVKKFCSTFLRYPKPCKSVFLLAKCVLMSQGISMLEELCGDVAGLLHRGFSTSYSSCATIELFSELCKQSKSGKYPGIEQIVKKFIDDQSRFSESDARRVSDDLLVHHVLPPYLNAFPKNAKDLHLTYQQVLDNKYSPRELVFIFSALKSRRLNGQVTEMETSLLLTGISSADHLVQIAALECLCLTSKTSQPLSTAELTLGVAGISIGLTCSYPAFRFRLLSCWKTLLQRIRDSCVPHIQVLTRQLNETKDENEGQQSQILLLPDLMVDWERLKDDLPSVMKLVTANSWEEQWQTILTLMTFMERMVCSRAIYPGSSFQRQTTVIDLIEMALNVWIPTAENTKTKGYTTETLAELKSFIALTNRSLKWSILSTSMRDFLLNVVLCSNRVVQEKCLNLLFTYFLDDNEIGEFDVKTLYDEAIILCNAAQSVKFQSGARILSFVFESSLFSKDQPKTEILLNFIKTSFQSAEGDLLEATRSSTGLGFLMAMSSLNTIVVDDEIYSHSQEIFDFLKEIITNLMTVMGCKDDESTKAAPSFEEMGISIMSSVRESLADESELEDCPSLPPHYQHVLSWAWNGIKISSNILVMLSVVLNKNRNQSLLKEVGECLVRCLTLTRHRGTIESVASSFESYCRILSDSEDAEIRLFPEYFLDKIFGCICESYSVTRRSAGLPLILTAILASQAKRQNKSCINRTISSLLMVASESNPKELTNDVTDPACVHALNLLQALVREALIVESVTAFHSKILTVAVRGFRSKSWSVRNSCLQLFSSLSLRMIGVNRPVMLVSEFFALYPDLRFLFNEMVSEVNTKSSLLEQQSVIPVLTLISKLSADPSTSEYKFQRQFASSIRPYLQNLLGSPILVLRQVTAKALLTVTSLEDRQDVFKDFMQRSVSVGNSNERHGFVLFCQQIIESIDEFEKEDARNCLNIVTDGVEQCATVGNWFLASYFVNLLNSVLKQSKYLPSTPVSTDSWRRWIKESVNHRMQSSFAVEAAKLLLRLEIQPREVLEGLHMKDIGEAFEQCTFCLRDSDIINEILNGANSSENDGPTRDQYLRLLKTIAENDATVLRCFESNKNMLDLLVNDTRFGENARSLHLQIATWYLSQSDAAKNDQMLFCVWLQKLEDHSKAHSEESRRLLAANCLKTFFSNCQCFKMFLADASQLYSLLGIISNLLLDEAPDIRRKACSVCASMTSNPYDQNHVICYQQLSQRLFHEVGETRDLSNFISAVTKSWQQLMIYLSSKIQVINIAKIKKVLYEPDDANVYREFRFVAEVLFATVDKSMKKFGDSGSIWKGELHQLYKSWEYLRAETSQLSDLDCVKYSVDYNLMLINFLLKT